MTNVAGESTSTAGVFEPMDLTSEGITNESVEDVSELMDINISRINTLQDHSRVADEGFETLLETNPFVLSYSGCDFGLGEL